MAADPPPEGELPQGFKKPKRKPLTPGTKIESQVSRYTVVKLLGSGGFGDVYLVRQAGTAMEFAMKTELNVMSELMERLKLEVCVLEDVTRSTTRRHFLTCADKGMTATFKFVVMDVIGKSLEAVRRDELMTNFTKTTAWILSLQTLEAIEDLHRLGWIHRDIKAQNFAIGLENKESVVYMLDFGIARKFRDNKGLHIKARTKANFLGTVKWASRACHKGEDQGRKDDLETWFYMVLDFFDDAALPWVYQRDKYTIATAKELLMREMIPEVYQNVPPKCAVIARYLRGLAYESEPNYAEIKMYLSHIAWFERIDIMRDVDWIFYFDPKRNKQNDEERRPLRKPKLTMEEQAYFDRLISKAAHNPQGVKLATGAQKRRSLEPGTEIATVTSRYTIDRLLGAGGFGDVYLVEQKDTYQRFAMKTEVYCANELMERLKIEIKVLEDCTNKGPSRGAKHFLTAIDKGKTGDFKFIVMDLIGKSIEAIRRTIMQCNFSKSTAIQIGLQTLEAIEDLHAIGWLHRDIKDENFAVGPNSEHKVVYIFDFGIARKYLDDDGAHFAARPKSSFIGTVKWASRACHRREDQGRKDDLESWLYMLIDLFDDGALPWNWIGNKDIMTVHFAKEAFMNEKISEPYTGTDVPSGIVEIMRYLNKLQYADQPDYKLLQGELRKIAETEKIDLTLPLDWADSLKPTKMFGRLAPDQELDATQNETLEWEKRSHFNATLGGQGLCKQRPNTKEQQIIERKILAAVQGGQHIGGGSAFGFFKGKGKGGGGGGGGGGHGHGSADHVTAPKEKKKNKLFRSKNQGDGNTSSFMSIIKKKKKEKQNPSN